MEKKDFPIGLFCVTTIFTMMTCLFLQPGLADTPNLAPTVQKPTLTQQKPTSRAEPTEQKPAPAAEATQPEPASPQPTRNVPAAVPSDTQTIAFATEFDLAQANRVAPEDVLSEIDYYGSGALPCPDSPYATPTVTYTPTMELLMPGYYVMCGWTPELSSNATVAYPDGRLEPLATYIEELEAGEYMAWLSFIPQLDDPEGEYTFRMEGGPFKAMATVYFYRPDGPRLLPISQDQLFFYGFAPWEPVRLFCYDVDYYNLLGWQEYQMDGDGQLTLDVTGERCNFAALGPQSGEVLMLIDIFPIGPVSWIHTSIRK